MKEQPCTTFLCLNVMYVLSVLEYFTCAFFLKMIDVILQLLPLSLHKINFISSFYIRWNDCFL